jgi:tetratricopeptide (TPR) repeat protein
MTQSCFSNAAQLYDAIGRKDRALELADKAAELAPKDASVLEDTGALHYMHGQREKAAQYFTRAVALKPGDGELKDRLRRASRTPDEQLAEAERLVGGSKYEDALSEYDDVLQNWPNHSPPERLCPFPGGAARHRADPAAGHAQGDLDLLEKRFWRARREGRNSSAAPG